MSIPETCHRCGFICVNLPDGGRGVLDMSKGELLFKKLPIAECKVKKFTQPVPRLLARTIVDLEDIQSG